MWLDSLCNLQFLAVACAEVIVILPGLILPLVSITR